MKQKKSVKPIFSAIISGFLASIPIGYGWYIAQIFVSFSASETLGGPEVYADWALPASLGVTICSIALDALIIVMIYKFMLKLTGNKTKAPIEKLLIISLPLPILLIMAFYGYQYYLTIRSGSLNPYIQECIKEGYKGAVGDSCIN